MKLFLDTSNRAKVTLFFAILFCVLVEGCAPDDELLNADKGTTWFEAGTFSIDFDYSHDEMLTFDVGNFLVENASHLESSADIITHTAAEERISPRLLIALMEQQSGALSNPDFDEDKPFADLSAATGFLEQYRDMCQLLRSTQFPQDAMSSLLTPDEMEDLGDVYQRLFPGVEATRRVNSAGSLGAAPALQFPYPIGVRWMFGGTHSSSGGNSPMSSLDFMARGESWGDTTSDPVVASAAGRAVRHSSCSVTIIHDDNWATSYYHLDNVVVRTNQTVQANQRIAHYADSRGQALCDGGSSTGPHLHWTLYRNNSQISLSGQVISGWTIHPGSSAYDTTCSRMYLHRNGERVCPWTPLENEGTNESTPSGDARIELTKSTYSRNERIVVDFYDLPGNQLDWIATYEAGAQQGAYIEWKYTRGRVNGRMRLPGLPNRGRYEVRLFENDSYDVLDRVSFNVE